MRREQLRTDTVRAAAAHWRSEEAASPQPGDIFLLPGADELPVEWLLIEKEPEPGAEVLLLAVDDRPWIGSSDVAVGVLCVRCAQDLRLDPKALRAGQHTGRLDASDLERIDQKRRDLDRGVVRASLLAWEADDDSEAVSWAQRLDRERTRLRSATIPSAAPLAFRRAARRTWHFSQALAAVFAVAALGLSLWIQQLHRQIDEIGAPFAIRSSATHDLRFGDTGRDLNLRLETTESHVVIYLVLSQVEIFPAYRLELLDAGSSRSIWRGDAIARDREILFVLPRARLKVDDLQLRLYGRDADGNERFLDEQTFRIDIKSSDER